MFSVLATLVVAAGIGFIFWQWKMLKKYGLSFDKLRINVAEAYLTLNGQKINFADVDHITVRELTQPTLWEKALSKSACYAYMAQMELHLKTGKMLPCTFNTKGALYYVLKQSQTHIPLAAHVDTYKPKTNWFWVLFIVVVILVIFLLS